MSRNFELLSRIGKERLLFPPVSSDLPPNEGRSPHLDQGAPAEEETVKPENEDLLFPEFASNPLPRDGAPNGREPRQLGRTVPVEEDGVKTEKEDLLYRRFTNDSPLRNGEGCEQAQNELIKLVQRVFVFANSRAPRLVVFSNVDEGSGSSEICFRVGDILAAQVSGSVCMVDANLRAPLLHQLLGIGRSPGLTDAMIDPDPIKDFAVPVTACNLWLMPPGSSAVEAPGLFASDRWCSRLAELKEEFDYVLIDAPPAGTYGDPVLLGQKADGVILVVEANSTRRETARMAKQTLEGAGVKLLGAILNNRTFPIPERLYRNL